MIKKAALAALLVVCVIYTACGYSATQKPPKDSPAEQNSSRIDTEMSTPSQEPLRSSLEASGTKSEVESNVDLSGFQGIWICSEKCIEKDSVMEYGGNIIEIQKIDGQSVKGTYTAVQEPPANRIASVDFEGTVSGNVLEYSFDDDGFGNKGTLHIAFGNDDNDIRATVSTEVSNENASGWSLGNGRFEFRRDGAKIEP